MQFVNDSKLTARLAFYEALGSIYPSRSDKVERAIYSPAANLNTLILARGEARRRRSVSAREPADSSRIPGAVKKNSKEHDEIGNSSFIHDFRESLEHCLNNSSRLLSLSYINIPLINMYIM